MGGLGQGEHYHPDGSFHSWSGVQFTGRKADVDVETGKIAPSSKGFEHQNVDTWAHPDAGREMNKRAQEEAYKRSLGLEMGGGTGYDASGLPNRRRTIEKYAPDAEFGLFSGSEQAPLPNAGAIASMGANGTGQSVYDEGMFDQPAEAYGTVHPHEPSMVPAMQETPLETSYQGLQSMEGRTGHFDTTHVPKYAGDEPSFIAAGNTDADKAAAFAARESRGGAGAEITHKQYDDTRQGELSPEHLKKIESGVHDPTYDYGGASGRGHRGGGHFDTLTGEWVPTTRTTDVVTDPMGTTTQTSKNEQFESGLSQVPNIMDMRRDEQQAQEMQEVEGGIYQQTVDPSRGLNAPEDEDFYGRSAFREEYEDLDAGMGFEGGESSDPRYNKYGLDRKLPTPPIVTELMGKDADIAGVQGQDTQGEAGEFDSDEGLSGAVDEREQAQRDAMAAERQQDTRDKEQYLKETDPEGFYEAEKQWGDKSYGDRSKGYSEGNMNYKMSGHFNIDYYKDKPGMKDAPWSKLKNPDAVWSKTLFNLEQAFFFDEANAKLVPYHNRKNKDDENEKFQSPNSMTMKDWATLKDDKAAWIAGGQSAETFVMPTDMKDKLAWQMERFLTNASIWGEVAHVRDKRIGEKAVPDYFTGKPLEKTEGIKDPQTRHDILWSALKDTGISIEEFKSLNPQLSNYRPSKHLENTTLWRNKEETQELPEGMFDASGQRMEDDLSSSEADASTAQDGAQINMGDGSVGTKNNNLAPESAGTTIEVSGENKGVIGAAQGYTMAIQQAMQGDLSSDEGRAALLAAIDKPVNMPAGYSWIKGELVYDDMYGGSIDGTTATAAGADTGAGTHRPEIFSPTTGAVGDTAVQDRYEMEEEALVARQLRMRDLATSAYETATGQSITRQGDLAMQREQAISREGQADLQATVSTNAKSYTTNMRNALQKAEKGDYRDIEAQLSKALPAPPPGLVWDNASQTFSQRPGFEGRMMDVETQQWMSTVEPAYKLSFRASKVADVGRKLQMESDNRETERQMLDDRFRQNMLTGDIDSAEEALARQRVAETQEIEDKGKRENLQMLMNLIQNPVSLGMAKRHGLLGQIESVTGVKLSDTIPDVPTGAGAPNFNEWQTMGQEEKSLRIADWVENGGDIDEFQRMIQGSAPGQMQRVHYGVVGQGGSFG